MWHTAHKISAPLQLLVTFGLSTPTYNRARDTCITLWETVMRRLYSAILLFSSCFALLISCSPPQQQSQRDSAAVLQAAPASSSSADASSATPSATTTDSYTDPFAYCAAITTIDAADDRFVGAAVPQEIVQELHRASGGQGDPPDWFPKTVQWRCMDGKVYACTIGANLPCNEKANTSQTPTDALKEFCKEHPNDPGREEKNSVYLWSCAGGTPQIERQWTNADSAGFLAKIWYEIKAP